jgi:hypothetical protein
MDKTTYLNHYYFITIISFVLLFLPANCYFSVDAYKMKSLFQNNKMEHRYSEITIGCLSSILLYWIQIGSLKQCLLKYGYPIILIFLW